MVKTFPLLLLATVFLITISYAEAQQPKKIPRIGILISNSPSASADRVGALQKGLHELGYVEEKSIIIDYRYAEGKPDNVPALVDELIGLKVDLIVVDTSQAAQAAKNATQTIPVVFTMANDPVGDGQVVSLASPGGNLTGFSLLTLDLNGKRLELLKETFPKITRVAFLPVTGEGVGEKRFKEAEIAAKGLGLQLQPLRTKGADDLGSGFDAAKRAGAQALITHPSTFVLTNRAMIIDLAVKHRLPAIYQGAQYAEAGGLMAYGPDVLDNWRRAAVYVDKILKGSKPSDLPVQQPTKFEFVINLKAANRIGVTIPPNVLARADRVIK